MDLNPPSKAENGSSDHGTRSIVVGRGAGECRSTRGRRACRSCHRGRRARSGSDNGGGRTGALVVVPFVTFGSGRCGNRHGRSGRHGHRRHGRHRGRGDKTALVVALVGFGWVRSLDADNESSDEEGEGILAVHGGNEEMNVVELQSQVG